MTTLLHKGSISLCWASCPKWATNQESECVDLVESLDGRIHVVLVDVQGSGSMGGRRLALSLAAFVSTQVGAGISAETAATSANQHLHALRDGKVGAAIHVLSVHPDTGRIALAGYGSLFVAMRVGGAWSFQTLASPLAGFHRDSILAATDRTLEPGAVLVVANDGFGSLETLIDWPVESVPDPLTLVQASNAAENDRPKSDKSIAVISRESLAQGNRIRTGSLQAPANGPRS